MESLTAAQRELCKRIGVVRAAPYSHQKIGIALETQDLEPLNGLRHSVEGDTCRWYIWGGNDLPPDSDFFQPLHVEHISERCPRALKYLALPPGWRFPDAPGHEDAWNDSSLLDPRE